MMSAEAESGCGAEQGQDKVNGGEEEGAYHLNGDKEAEKLGDGVAAITTKVKEVTLSEGVTADSMGPKGEDEKVKEVKEGGGDEKGENHRDVEATVTVTDKKEEEKPQPAPVPTQRAVVLTSFGGLKNVRLADKPIPQTLKDDEVLIKVLQSGLSLQDVYVRVGAGLSEGLSPPSRPPLILGSELIGEVVRKGGQVTKVSEGDRVFAILDNGAWTETVCAHQSQVFLVTEKSVGLPQLGSTFPYLVAYLLMRRAGLSVAFDKPRPQIEEEEKREKILVHSALGSVGLALAELANLRGYSVIGMTSGGKVDLDGKSDEEKERISAASARFSHLLKRGKDIVSEVRKVAPNGVLAVFDPLGGEDFSRGLPLLAPLGTYVLFGNANTVVGEGRGIFSFFKTGWGTVEKMSPLRLFAENKGVAGLHVRNLLKQMQTQNAGSSVFEAELSTIWGLMAEGKVQPLADSTFHYEQAIPAFTRLQERKNIGRILINPEPQPEVSDAPAATAVTSTDENGGEEQKTNGEEGEAAPTN